jgi:hypothetical protein
VGREREIRWCYAYTKGKEGEGRIGKIQDEAAMYQLLTDG